MTTSSASTKAVLVFDVNVLIDAANPHSRHHESAVRALSDDNDMPVYFSDLMLKTTANKLLEMGADPGVVREYIDLIMSEDDYGPEKHTLGYIPVTDYGLVDRYGNADYEDSTIISLMDAAESHAQSPAVLVSNDGALRDWCDDHHRVAVRPDKLPGLSSRLADDLQQMTYQYLSRRMFRDGHQGGPSVDTKKQARQIVQDVRSDIAQRSVTERTKEHFRRFPELRSVDEPHLTPEDDSLQL